MHYRKLFTRSLAAASALLLTPCAFAHPGHEQVQGFWQGLAHSFSGADHLAAMLAVGFLAQRHKTSAQSPAWLLPMAFVFAMAIGAAAPLLQPTAPLALWIEPGIFISLIALGGLMALTFSLPLSGLLALMGIFGFAHGYAHGSEIPQNMQGELFMLGALSASAILHSTGFLLASKLQPLLVRLSGLAIAALGLVLVFN